MGTYFTIHAQDIFYYQLTKTKINGAVSQQNNGGQFICIYEDFCYDCNINGTAVNNGQLHLKNKGEYIIYYGESYFGKNTYYKFNTNFSHLNIVAPNGDIYAYKRTNPPINVTTCSLIKKRGPNRNIATTPNIQNNIYVQSPSNINTNNSPSNNAQIKETKYMTKCHYCNGTGTISKDSYSPTFGLTQPDKWCTECNRYYPASRGHYHINCNHCRGTGQVERTKYEYK